MKKRLLTGIFLSMTLGVFALESLNFKDSFKTKSGIKTQFEFKSDSYWLYLKIQCMEPEMKKLKATGKVHDVDVWKDDNVEIFINPERQGEIFAQFAVSPSGVMYDAKINGRARDANWNPANIKIKSFRGTDFWGVELKFPIAVFVSLFPDLKGKKRINANSWSFNIVRNRRVGQRETVSYSDCSDWLDTTKYTRLKGIAAAYKALLWNVNGVALFNIKPLGKNKGYKAQAECTIDNVSDKMRIIVLSAILSAPQKGLHLKLFEKKIVLDRGQMFRMNQEVFIPKLGPYNLEICLSDNQNGMLGYASAPVKAEYVPMRLEIVSGAYRGHDIFYTMHVSKLGFRLKTGHKYTINANDKCVISLTNVVDGRKITSKEFTAIVAFEKKLILPIPKLVPGKYICKVQFTNSDIPSSHTMLMVHPEVDDEVYINGSGNFVRNGKEFFPIGAFGAWWAWEQYPHREMIDYSLAYAPTRKLTVEWEQKWNSYAQQGWSTAYFPEPPDLWSHYATAKGAKIALRPILPENARRIFDRVKQYRGKKFVFGWYLADEPTESKNLPQYLEQCNKIVHEADPYHPTIMVFNSESCAKIFGQYCDVVGVDYFPGFHELGQEQSLTTFASLLKNVAKATEKSKPIIAALPTYAYARTGRAPARYPTYAEQRCMCFIAMTCDNVRGLCWNDVSQIGVSPELFFGIPAITVEMRKLENVWLSRKFAKLKKYGSDASKLFCVGKVVNGELYAITVNPNTKKLNVKLMFPSRFKSIRELAATNKKIDVKDGMVKLEYAPLQVRIFSSDANAPALEPFESVCAKIESFADNEAESGNLCHIFREPEVICSPAYKNVLCSPASHRWLTDGLFTRTYRIVPNPKMDPMPWLGIRFKKTETVSRFEIGWKLHLDKLSDNNILFEIEGIDINGHWHKIPEKNRKIIREGAIIKAIIQVAPVKLKSFRVVFGKQDRVLLSPCELKAFK